VITTTEGAALHLDRLRTQPDAFDPDVRDRLIAGALLPSGMLVQAQKFRRWYRDAVLRLFEVVDVILAPSPPCTAPLIGSKTLALRERNVPLRPTIGIYTQPISFIGLPVAAVPVPRASRAARRGAGDRRALAGGCRAARRAFPGTAGQGTAAAPQPALD